MIRGLCILSLCVARKKKGLLTREPSSGLYGTGLQEKQETADLIKLTTNL